MQRIERSVWSALSPRRFALCENQSGEDSRRSIRSALLNTQLEIAVIGLFMASSDQEIGASKQLAPGAPNTQLLIDLTRKRFI